MSRLALVTGGSSGIGAAIVEEFGKAGHRLAFSYREDRDGAEALVARMASVGVDAQAFPCDLADPHAAEALAETVTRAMGQVSILVNNAGPGRATPLEPGIGAAMREITQVGLASALELSAHVTPGMGAGDVILNISSLNGREPPATVSAFAAMKAGLDAATRALALELGPRGIRVVGIAPGPIERADAPRPDALRDKIRSKTALPRFGSVTDVAHLARFVVSEQAGFLTGETIGLHGGWH
ncbi:SDR family NAD(P)-dependent oxidoreductase [Cognatishimia sp. F0-27]|uniref:SDR family NAD(P)-dependent oxidoreductase n=1 Tax=Cognatishimia sp. F0-27 TaxID=2816855 RepID=UPI001D0C02AD|nr:SDR family oxidoreductase [Cognatishimia sp. F0-27]MCC1492580.1 SDR family oxidoreductase [Cognatishimia sp. F0-27]